MKMRFKFVVCVRRRVFSVVFLRTILLLPCLAAIFFILLLCITFLISLRLFLFSSLQQQQKNEAHNNTGPLEKRNFFSKIVYPSNQFLEKKRIF